MTRMTLGMNHAALAAFSILAAGASSLVAAGCAEDTATGEQRVHIVRNQETAAEVGGIPPDKEADIQLLLQQRDPSTLKCYEDVLNDKHDRAFKGTVLVLLSLAPGAGDNSKVKSVKVIGGTLNNEEVSSCLVEKLSDFEYPQIPNPGTMQYTYKFEPAY
jgi:hypothetical protein